MIYSIILAAGNQSRFKSQKPKALFVLEENINNIKDYVDKIFVVCNSKNKKYFEEVQKDFEIVEIESGFGCGDAVLKALQSINEISYSDLVLLSWGDSIQEKSVIEYTINNYSGRFLMPVVEEIDPYVKVVEKNKIIQEILFSKLGDNTSGIGYHDMSVFLFNKYEVIKALEELKNIQEFTNTIGKELIFLNIFNYSILKGEILEVMFTSAKAFNTLEEYQLIKGD